MLEKVYSEGVRVKGNIYICFNTIVNITVLIKKTDPSLQGWRS